MARITRTVTKANAWAWVVDGVKDDGTPNVTKTAEVEFTSTQPNQLQAFRALKQAGIKVRKDMCQYTIVSETVYACTLEQFLTVAVPVQRDENGYVRDMPEIVGPEDVSAE